MRLGLNIGYSRSQLGIDLSLVQQADRLGFHSVWSAEAYGSDAVSPLCWIAAQTSRIKVGTAIMQIPARTPTLTATTAMTIDQLSGGRFILGLGVSARRWWRAGTAWPSASRWPRRASTSTSCEWC